MWKMMTSFAFSLPNRPGELAWFTDQLRSTGISLVGLWGYAPSMPQATEMRVSCVPESAAAFRTFFRSSDVPMEEGRTFFLSGEDRIGALVDSLKRIADAGINVDAIESVAMGDRFGCFIWADQKDWKPLEDLLSGASTAASEPGV